MKSIESKSTEQRDTEFKYQIPFRNLELPFDFSDLSIRDLEDVQREIFESWFQHQEIPVLDAVCTMRIENPQNSHDFLKNLLVDSYLFGKRSSIRRQIQGRPDLKDVYVDERRRDFALEDVRLQQNAVLFLLNSNNQELNRFFWDDFNLNQDINRQGKKEKTAGERGIKAVLQAISNLRELGYEICLPAPEMDAHDKIDLIAERGDELVFVQVKSKGSGKNNGDQDKQKKLEIFKDNIDKYIKSLGRNINPLIIEV